MLVFLGCVRINLEGIILINYYNQIEMSDLNLSFRLILTVKRVYLIGVDVSLCNICIDLIK